MKLRLKHTPQNRSRNSSSNNTQNQNTPKQSFQAVPNFRVFKSGPSSAHPNPRQPRDPGNKENIEDPSLFRLEATMPFACSTLKGCTPENKKPQQNRRRILLTKSNKCTNAASTVSNKRGRIALVLQDQQTQQPLRPSLQSSKFLYQNLQKNFDKALVVARASEKLTYQNIIDVLSCLGYLPANYTPQDEQLVEALFKMLEGPTKGVKRENLFLFLLIIGNVGNLGAAVLKDDHFRTEVTQSSTVTGNHSSCSGLHRDCELFFFPEHAEDDSENSTIPKLGTFDTHDNWSLSQAQQRQVRRMFGKLYYNRISNEHVKYKRSSSQENYSFQPRILHSSKEIAQNKRSNVLAEASRYLNLRVETQDITVADFFAIQQKVRTQKIEDRRIERLAGEVKECSFKPKINTPKGRFSLAQGNKSRCQQLYDISKTKSLEKGGNRLSTLEETELKELKECSFKPSSTKFKGVAQKKAQVKNQAKVIQRMREGRQRRMAQSFVKERGYPPNVENWHTFIRNIKRIPIDLIENQTPLSHTPPRMQQPFPVQDQHNTDQQYLGTRSHTNKPTPIKKKPIISLDVKFSNEHVEALQVYEGDSLEHIACKILAKNKFPYEYFGRIHRLINEVLLQSGSVELENGFIYLRS